MSDQEEENKKREMKADLDKLSSVLSDLMRSLQEPSLDPSLDSQKVNKKEESQKALVSRFDHLSRKMSSGFKTTMQALIDMGQFLTQNELAACTHSFSEISMIHEIVDKHWCTILEKMAHGEEISTALGISSNGLQGMYDLAKKLFEYQHFEESTSCFCLLALLAPEQQIFWLGLGHSEYCLGAFKDATIAYTMASEVSPQDPAPHLFMAHCYRAQKEDLLIPYCFGLAEQAASTDAVLKEVRESVRRLRAAWKI